MSEKSFRKSEFKRTIDLGKTDRGQDTDLIRVWRESSGEEKAISLGDINGGLIGDYVPYTGAVDDVDLGEKGLSTGYVKYDTTPTSTPTTQGTTYWDVDDNTLAIIMNGTTLKVGEDQYYPVKNQTGVLIPKGTAVRFAGTLGASGRLLIAPFLADGSLPSSRFMGVTSEDIGNGEDGKVMWFGRIRGINTNAFNEGDILYASTTVAGGFQTTVPTPPNNIVEVCAVIHKSASNGIIFVRPTFITSVQAGAGLSLDSLNQIQLGNDGAGVVDISDRDIFEEGFVIKDNGVNSGNRFSLLENELNLELYEVDPIGGDSELFLDWGASIFRAKVTYFPVEGGKKIQTISIGSNGKGGGIRNPFLMIITDEINSKGFEYTTDYSANWTDHSLVTKSWVLGQVSGSAHTPVTIGTPANGLSIDGSQVLSLGLASTSATGALSSTDWNTFNNKLNLTSPITGYAVGANTALADTDTILQAFGKVQGQINARISGSGVSERLAIYNGTNSVTSFVNINYVNSANRLDIRDNSSNVQIALRGTASGGILAGGTGGASTLFHRPGGDGVGTNQIIHNLTGFGIGNISPTNTLDVNGTARIRTINNLGSAATSVLVPSATGVVSLRTLAELASDGTFITGTGVSGRVAFWSGTGTQSSDSSLLWNNTTKTLEIQFSGVSVANRGLIISQYSNDVAAPAFQAFKARGTNASPLNVNAGDLVSAFAYRPRIGGVFVLDRALFGAVMTSLTGISQYFIAGTTNENYIPNLIVHHSGGVGIGLGGSITLNTVVAPTARLDVRGFGTTTGLTAILEDSAGTNNVEFVDNGQIRFLRLPTSSAGLAAGSLWNNGGVLNIV